MPPQDEITQADLEKEFESFGQAERKILKAAVTVFAEKGYDGAGTGEIAARAGVNKAMLYYYFKSKEGLYTVIIETVFKEITLILGDHLSRLSSRNPEQGVSSFVDSYLDFVYAHRIFVKVMLWELARGGSIMARVVGRILKPHTQQVLDMFNKAARDGDLRPVDPRHLIVSIMGMMLFYFFAEPVVHTIWGEDPMTPEHIAKRKKEVANLIIHGISPKQG
jgi:TetR/AcrR family transcriptional regulator